LVGQVVGFGLAAGQALVDVQVGALLVAPGQFLLDAGAAQRQALGIVVIGGLTSSLLLTLVLVPVMFMWLGPKPKIRSTTDSHELPELSVSGAAT